MDTIPDNAELILNGKKHTELTPVTFKHLAPGTYTLELKKEGFFTWQKKVRIDPERVTFVTDIHLWPQETPEKITAQTIHRLFATPDGSTILTIQETTSQTMLSLLNPRSGEIKKTLPLPATTKISHVRWDASGRKALIESEEVRWLLDTERMSLTTLPPANGFHWEDGTLVGMENESRITIQTNGSISRTEKPKTEIDRFKDISIEYKKSENQWILKTDSDKTQGFLLPSNAWQFYQTIANGILLNAGSQWLWISEITKNPKASQANASQIYPATFNRETKILLQDRNAVSIWEAEKEPELIFRHSEPIRSVAWYPDGTNILIATKNDLRLFEVQAQENRVVTNVAAFEEIQDAVLIEETIFIAGTYAGEEGLWRLPLTRKNSIIPPLSDLR